jgi:hypothetical protein
MTRLRPLMLCVAALMAVLSLSAVPDIERIDSSAAVARVLSREPHCDVSSPAGSLPPSRQIAPARLVPVVNADLQSVLSTFRI